MYPKNSIKFLRENESFKHLLLGFNVNTPVTICKQIFN